MQIYYTKGKIIQCSNHFAVSDFSIRENIIVQRFLIDLILPLFEQGRDILNLFLE